MLADRQGIKEFVGEFTSENAWDRYMPGIKAALDPLTTRSHPKVGSRVRGMTVLGAGMTNGEVRCDPHPRTALRRARGGKLRW